MSKDSKVYKKVTFEDIAKAYESDNPDRLNNVLTNAEVPVICISDIVDEDGTTIRTKIEVNPLFDDEEINEKYIEKFSNLISDYKEENIDKKLNSMFNVGKHLMTKMLYEEFNDLISGKNNSNKRKESDVVDEIISILNNLKNILN